MPHLVIAAVLGAGLFAGARFIARAAQKMAEDARRTQEDLMRQATGAVEKRRSTPPKGATSTLPDTLTK